MPDSQTSQQCGLTTFENKSSPGPISSVLGKNGRGTGICQLSGGAQKLLLSWRLGTVCPGQKWA